MTGAPSPDYRGIAKLNFGDDALAHTTRQKINNSTPRSVECISLYPSGNAQGSWIFMFLLTGKRTHRYQWDIIPIAPAIVKRVDAVARNEGQPIVTDNFKYKWYPGYELEEAEYVEREDEPPPSYRNLTHTEMVHDHREDRAIEAAEEVQPTEVVDEQVREWRESHARDTI